MCRQSRGIQRGVQGSNAGHFGADGPDQTRQTLRIPGTRGVFRSLELEARQPETLQRAPYYLQASPPSLFSFTSLNVPFS